MSKEPAPEAELSLQASTVQTMNAHVIEHNNLLQQLMASFPSTNPGISVTYFDFGKAFDQVCCTCQVLRRVCLHWLLERGSCCVKTSNLL